MEKSNTDNLMDFSKDKRDYILARLLVVKKYIKENNSEEALACLDFVMHDIETNYDSTLT